MPTSEEAVVNPSRSRSSIMNLFGSIRSVFAKASPRKPIPREMPSRGSSPRAYKGKVVEGPLGLDRSWTELRERLDHSGSEDDVQAKSGMQGLHDYRWVPRTVTDQNMIVQVPLMPPESPVQLLHPVPMRSSGKRIATQRMIQHLSSVPQRSLERRWLTLRVMACLPSVLL